MATVEVRAFLPSANTSASLSIYPNHSKMQNSVGVRNALDNALIADNGHSLFKINNAV